MKTLIIIAAMAISSPLMANCVNILGEPCDKATSQRAPEPAQDDAQGETGKSGGPLNAVDEVISTIDRIDRQGQELKRLLGQ